MYLKFILIVSLKRLENSHSVHALKSHHQARFDVRAGCKMHSGDQQSPVAQEGESLATELRCRASGHRKPYNEEAETGTERLQGA